MRRGQVLVFILMAGIIISGISPNVKAERNWAITTYWARLIDGDLDNSLSFRANFEDSYLLAVGLSRKLYSFRDLIDFELEGQIVKHFENQDHWEFNSLLVSRWLLLPWDKYVDTGLAMGAGLSYATKTQEIEDKNHSETSQ